MLLACAGSRKTTQLVERALASTDHSVLVTTYTQENLSQLKETFVGLRGCVPPHVTLATWYSFLLHECVRPYQRVLGVRQRIAGMSFPTMSEVVRRSTPRSDTKAYYVTAAGDLHRDRVAEFAWHANVASGGAVVTRLEAMYRVMLIDEVQDMVGWDLELLWALFHSRIAITCVGDLRQATYATANTTKNKAFRGPKLMVWLKRCEKDGLITIEERSESFRCNQLICDFSDRLYPEMAATVSREVMQTDHDGIIPVPWDLVQGYCERWNPQILRDDKDVNTQDLPAMNFGAVKGRTFDRVLVFPTKAMAEYFETGEQARLRDRSRARLYVAATRARYSVAHVTEQPTVTQGD